MENCLIKENRMETSIQHAGAMVLVVDDNPENLRLLGSVLETQGYATAMALNARDALAFAAGEKPDLILLDIMMPEIDGYETAKQLKNEKTTRDIPIIFLTAKTESEDIVRGFNAGAVDYVAKPFNTAELLARIRTHIELKHARDEIRTLRGILPVCANCKSIRNDTGEWETMETYLHEHSEAEFSHGLCPACLKKLYPQMADDILTRMKKEREQKK
jgi:DNA-binding response OmpR family regulator